MFTGLIETTGELTQIRRLGRGMAFGVIPRMQPFATEAGASVSVNGACLTVESISGDVVFFSAVSETLACTTLSKARVGDRVNLERALRVGGRVEGHFVLGHVDGIGVISFLRRDGNGMACGIRPPEGVMRSLAEKGSVAVDGISLTIAKCKEDEMEIAFIPYTLRHTCMPRKRMGDEVNIECDVLARYAARYLQTAGDVSAVQPHAPAGSGSLFNLLERSGF